MKRDTYLNQGTGITFYYKYYTFSLLEVKIDISFLKIIKNLICFENVNQIIICLRIYT